MIPARPRNADDGSWVGCMALAIWFLVVAACPIAADGDRDFVRLGGIGTGWISIGKDATFGPVLGSPIGMEAVGVARGSFAALWTEAGGVRASRVLAGSSGYGLPVSRQIRSGAHFPFADATFADDDLPVQVELRAFVPVLMHDATASNLPCAVFVYRLKNVARAPVQAAVAMSWETMLGRSGRSRPGVPLEGVAVRRIPPSDGAVGLRFDGPELRDELVRDLRVHNARGSEAVLAEYPLAADASTAVWDVSEVQPSWWPEFADRGQVSVVGVQHTPGQGMAAACVAMRLALKAGETKEIAFAVAWYRPRLYDGSGQAWVPAYARRFADAQAVATHVLKDRRMYATLSEEWQVAVRRSPLGASRVEALAAELEEMAACSFYGSPDRDERRPPVAFRLAGDSREPNDLLSPAERARLQGCLLAAFPELDALDLSERVSRIAEAVSNRAEDAALVRLVHRHLERTHDTVWLTSVWAKMHVVVQRMWADGEAGPALDSYTLRALKDLAASANDSKMAEELAGRSAKRELPSGIPVVSAWSAWDERLGCALDQGGVLKLMPSGLEVGRILAGPVFHPRFMATVEYRPRPVGLEVSFRVDRLFRPHSGMPDTASTGGLTLAALEVPLLADAAAVKPQVVLSRGPIGVALVTVSGRVVRIDLDTPVLVQTGDTLAVSLGKTVADVAADKAALQAARRP